MKSLTQASFESIELDGVEGVLLDLDDTLYCYAPCHIAALRACFARHDFGLSFPEFRVHYRAARDAVTRTLQSQGACRSRLFAFMKMAEVAAIPSSYELAFALDEIYWSTFIAIMEPHPRALEFLKRCSQAKVPTCIVTDMTAHIQIRKIARLGIAPHINCLVTSEEVGVEKPDQAMFATAVSKLGVRADRCLMLGDNVEKDVEGAILLGITAHLICLPAPQQND